MFLVDFFSPKSNTDRVVTSAEVLLCYICHALALADILMCGGVQQLNMKNVGRPSAKRFLLSSLRFN